MLGMSVAEAFPVALTFLRAQKGTWHKTVCWCLVPTKENTDLLQMQSRLRKGWYMKMSKGTSVDFLKNGSIARLAWLRVDHPMIQEVIVRFPRRQWTQPLPQGPAPGLCSWAPLLGLASRPPREDRSLLWGDLLEKLRGHSVPSPTWRPGSCCGESRKTAGSWWQSRCVWTVCLLILSRGP